MPKERQPLRPLLIGTPEVFDQLQPGVRAMLDNEGFYLGSMPADPQMGTVPLASIGGKVFSMKIDSELPPDRFIAGTRFEGPFLPTVEDPQTCTCANCSTRYNLGDGVVKEPDVIGLWGRLDAGSEVPVGDCPECGAFCYLDKHA